MWQQKGAVHIIENRALKMEVLSSRQTNMCLIKCRVRPRPPLLEAKYKKTEQKKISFLMLPFYACIGIYVALQHPEQYNPEIRGQERWY